MDFNKIKRAHFIAIGGIGMSALAKMMKDKGIYVTGSDLKDSEIIKDLKEKYNIPVYIGSSPEFINKKIDIIIYSPAVFKTDPERTEAERKNIEQYSYPEALGKISENIKTVAVSGTNGKTTTTSMIVELLKEQFNCSPLGIVGGILQKYKTNYIKGTDNLFITEACEFKSSFLNIKADIIIITNIVEDHLDYFKNLEDIQNAFIEFIDKSKKNAVLICNPNLENLKPIVYYAKKRGLKIIDYSKILIKNNENLKLKSYDLENKYSALSTIEDLGFDKKKAIEYLDNEFKGIKRRIEYIGETKKGSLIYDDYAHNPDGILYLISNLKKLHPKKKIIIIFQPHLYTRTEQFKKEFIQALSNSDYLFILPTFRSREKYIEGKEFILSELLKEQKVNFSEIKSVEEILENKNFKEFNQDCVIVTAGAGSVWEYSRKLKGR